jgi:iron complex outermembrane recepter protein
MNRTVARAIHLALASVIVAPLASAFAQQKAAESPDMQEVVITGMRHSIEQALEIKRESGSVIEVVSAEDIGKLPDHNVADALQRLPGVNISSQAAGEGGFDENDRVSIRGTSPSLTQTTINGHAVATGDWFILDQFQTVGRSVSFSLLPSEIVSQVVVHKAQTADLTEGGVAGTVDIQTRKPLDFARTFTAQATFQDVYADLPKKNAFQGNALIAWRNDTIGVLAQVFDEERKLRRDGQEFLGYTNIPATITNGAGQTVPNPFFLGATVPSTGVAAPTLIGSALFEQTRKRYGADVDLQIRPSDRLTLDVNGFYSKLDAHNINYNYLAWVSNMLAVQPTAVTVSNGTLTSATWAPQTAKAPVVYDQLSRPGSNAQTYYLDFDTKFVASDRLTITTQLGYTHGLGNTPDELNYESASGTTGNPPPNGIVTPIGFTYTLHGLSPATVAFPGLNSASNAQFANSWGWSDIAQVIDVEKYAQADALLKLDNGIWQSVKFGVRYADHQRVVNFPEDGRCLNFCPPNSPVPAWAGGTYPGNYGSGLGSGFPTNIWNLSSGEIYQWGKVQGNIVGGPSRLYWPGEMNVAENDTAVYGMVDFGGAGWHGNIGLRLVDTHELSVVNVPNSAAANNATLAFGGYTPTPISHDYFNVLPSVNLKFDLTPDLVARVGATGTMARPDYSALGGSVSLNDLAFSGSGGNPNLKPIRSSNYDASLEWYFAPASLISLGLFYMDMASYVDFGVAPATYYSQFYKQNTVYQVTSPFNTSAFAKGYELSWIQPIWQGFGVEANFTHADGSTASGSPLVGMSNTTYNLVGYYENTHFSARLAYTYRSAFLVGLDRSFAETEDGIGSLAAAVNVILTDNVVLSFEGLNLTDSKLKYYANNTTQPRAIYDNGRQYYVGVRLKY